jgi:hypothetical protein
MTMKSKKFLWFTMSLMAVILTVPRTVSAEDERRYERREEWRERQAVTYTKDDRRRLEGMSCPTRFGTLDK